MARTRAMRRVEESIITSLRSNSGGISIAFGNLDEPTKHSPETIMISEPDEQFRFELSLSLRGYLHRCYKKREAGE